MYTLCMYVQVSGKYVNIRSPLIITRLFEILSQLYNTIPLELKI